MEIFLNTTKAQHTSPAAMPRTNERITPLHEDQPRSIKSMLKGATARNPTSILGSVLADFQSQGSSELTVWKGEEIFILFEINDWAFVTSILNSSRRGYIPLDYCDLVKDFYSVNPAVSTWQVEGTVQSADRWVVKPNPRAKAKRVLFPDDFSKLEQTRTYQVDSARHNLPRRSQSMKQIQQQPQQPPRYRAQNPPSYYSRPQGQRAPPKQQLHYQSLPDMSALNGQLKYSAPFNRGPSVHHATQSRSGIAHTAGYVNKSAVNKLQPRLASGQGKQPISTNNKPPSTGGGKATISLMGRGNTLPSRPGLETVHEVVEGDDPPAAGNKSNTLPRAKPESREKDASSHGTHIQNLIRQFQLKIITRAKTKIGGVGRANSTSKTMSPSGADSEKKGDARDHDGSTEEIFIGLQPQEKLTNANDHQCDAQTKQQTSGDTNIIPVSANLQAPTTANGTDLHVHVEPVSHLAKPITISIEPPTPREHTEPQIPEKCSACCLHHHTSHPSTPATTTTTIAPPCSSNGNYLHVLEYLNQANTQAHVDTNMHSPPEQDRSESGLGDTGDTESIHSAGELNRKENRSQKADSSTETKRFTDCMTQTSGSLEDLAQMQQLEQDTQTSPTPPPDSPFQRNSKFRQSKKPQMANLPGYTTDIGRSSVPSDSDQDLITIKTRSLLRKRNLTIYDYKGLKVTAIDSLKRHSSEPDRSQADDGDQATPAEYDYDSSWKLKVDTTEKKKTPEHSRNSMKQPSNSTTESEQPSDSDHDAAVTGCEEAQIRRRLPDIPATQTSPLDLELSRLSIRIKEKLTPTRNALLRRKTISGPTDFADINSALGKKDKREESGRSTPIDAVELEDAPSVFEDDGEMSSAIAKPKKPSLLNQPTKSKKMHKRRNTLHNIHEQYLKLEEARLLHESLKQLNTALSSPEHGATIKREHNSALPETPQKTDTISKWLEGHEFADNYTITGSTDEELIAINGHKGIVETDSEVDDLVI